MEGCGLPCGFIAVAWAIHTIKKELRILCWFSVRPILWPTDDFIIIQKTNEEIYCALREWWKRIFHVGQPIWILYCFTAASMERIRCGILMISYATNVRPPETWNNNGLEGRRSRIFTLRTRLFAWQWRKMGDWMWMWASEIVFLSRKLAWSVGGHWRPAATHTLSGHLYFRQTSDIRKVFGSTGIRSVKRLSSWKDFYPKAEAMGVEFGGNWQIQLIKIHKHDFVASCRLERLEHCRHISDIFYSFVKFLVAIFPLSIESFSLWLQVARMPANKIELKSVKIDNMRPCSWLPELRMRNRFFILEASVVCISMDIHLDERNV